MLTVILLLLASSVNADTVNASQINLQQKALSDWMPGYSFFQRITSLQDFYRGLQVLRSWFTTTTSKPATRWDLYKLQYGKEYLPEEDEQRMALFELRHETVSQHNARYVQGEESFTLEINEYADWFTGEMDMFLRGIGPQTRRASAMKPVKKHRMNAARDGAVPDSMDWREKGAVTPPGKQGQCASSWAFAVASAIESQIFLNSGKLVPLSAQQLVDCSKDGVDGCDGGDLVSGFMYVWGNGGITEEQLYPYTEEGGSCRLGKENVQHEIIGYEHVTNELELKIAVALFGPVAAVIDTNNDDFLFYREGVYNVQHCDSDASKGDHAVLVVGYGTTENGTDYWLIKNSLGTLWGEAGYMKLARNNNLCGIASAAIYPIV